MKTIVKKPSALTESLIEVPEEIKGKNISIYLNAESLQYLDQLVQIYKAKGRSEVIQQMIIQTKRAYLSLIPMLGGDKSPLAELIKKAGLGES